MPAATRGWWAFYIRERDLDEYRQHFPDHTFGTPVPFRDKRIVGITK
ncbi:MAG: hypothetical protein ACE5R4_04400 [Armatimonadota bacterium]